MRQESKISDGVAFFDAAVRLLREGRPPMPPYIPEYVNYIRYGSVYWHCENGPLVLRWAEKIRQRRDWYGYAEPLLAYFFPCHPFRRPEWRPPEGITEGENPSNAIGWAARKHGWCEWDLADDGLGVHFEPHPGETEALREFTLPLREVLFLDGDESADAVEAWLGAAKHAVQEFGRPRPYRIGEQTQDLFLTAVQEYTAAKEALSRARALEAVPQPAAEEAEDAGNS